MSVKRIYKLDRVDNGDIMLWNLYCRTSATFKAKLYDSSAVYFDSRKCGVSKELQKIAEGCQKKGAGELKFEIIYAESASPAADINSRDIVRPDASLAGHTYNICVGDYSDAGYNDIYFSLVSWKEN